MPFFKRKDKNAPAASPPQSQAPPPAESRPDLRQEASNSTFSNVPSTNDRDRESNLSSADTRVNHQRDSDGNRQTVVTTTTTTTTTTVTSDGRVITEQHDRPASELPATRSPRPRSPDIQAQQQPVQTSTTTTPIPSIPHRDARRGSHGAEPLTSSNMLQPPPPIPAAQQHQQQSYEQQHYQPQYQQQQAVPVTPSSPTSTSSANFSRPGGGGRREKIKNAAIGLNGASEGLRGLINTKAGELLGDDPETLARNREVRDKGLRDVRGSGLMQHHQQLQQRKGVGSGGGYGEDERTRLRRKSGNLGDDPSRNF